MQKTKGFPKRLLTRSCEDNHISLLYLFGSHKEAGKSFLEGLVVEPIRNSDLDVGIVFETLPESRMQAYGIIYAALAEIFEPFSVDPVFLQETDYLFQYEAIKGELVYFESERHVDRYEDMVLRLASDCAFHLEEFQKEVAEALSHGYFEIG